MTSELCGTCRYFDDNESCCHLRMFPVTRRTRACPEWQSLADYARRAAALTVIACATGCVLFSVAAAALAR